MTSSDGDQAQNRAGNASGGSGFLFGNIDRRGRLDEDYMDEEAKDHLDNVAPTVAERDPHLKEITRASQRNKVADDDEDYDSEVSAGNEAAQPRDPNAEDYFDEDEVMDDLDEGQRQRMASLALASVNRASAAKASNSDDENYDEDEEDGAGSGVDPASRPSVSLPKPVPNDRPELPALGKPEPAVEALAPPCAASASNVPALPKPSASDLPVETQSGVPKLNLQSAVADAPQPAVSAEEAAQLALLAAARRGAATLEPRPVAEEEKFPDDEPLRFSKILTQQRRKMKMVPKRRRYGVLRENEKAFACIVCEKDDTVELGKPLPLPQIDPVRLLLQSDPGVEKTTRKPIPVVRAASNNAMFDVKGAENVVDPEEYMEAAAPLGRPDVGIPSENKFDVARWTSLADADYHMLQQCPWENEIDWDGPDEEDGYKDADMEGNGKGVVDKDANRMSNGEHSDSDSDDMEWEDGAMGSGEAEKVSTENEPRAMSQNVTENPSAASSACQSASTTKDAANMSIVRAQNKPGLGVAKSLVLTPPLVRISAETMKGKLVGTVLSANKELNDGNWLHEVAWDSDYDSQTTNIEEDGLENPDQATAPGHRASRTDRLILDMNDNNMILEPVQSCRNAAGGPVSTCGSIARPTAALVPSFAAILPELAPHVFGRGFRDPFNVSNDAFYVRQAGESMLKIDRRAILRSLRNAPPATKAQTTVPNPPEEYLERFHRPIISLDSYPSRDLELIPFRRKHPKGGSSQIAGQIPKKQSELMVSTKDAFRVCLFEYALEFEPCMVPIPGTAFQVVTYNRKGSAKEAAQARKDATGTPEADTVFMAPEEIPPLYAGDLKASDKPLLVVESHLFSAPCARAEPSSNDFLVSRRRGKMYVREIDSLVSVGVTEPKLEVMAPNTERFKKFSKDRILLWVLREFLKAQKHGDGEASIDRESLFAEFTRRRTFAETSLVRMLKEVSRYHNGKYVLIEEPAKGFASMDAELLRTINPEETSAFEAMESGWHRLISTGIHIFTHPSSQSHILAAAEKTGLDLGPAVGAVIWNRLLRTPWYRSQTIITVQRQQRKELLHALAAARIANDLREGGAVMEARVASLTTTEAANVLTNQYKIQLRKVPQELEARRELVRENALKKGKLCDYTSYEDVISNIIAKQRLAVASRSVFDANSPATGNTAGITFITLEDQRQALEHGVADKLPIEDDQSWLPDGAHELAKASGGNGHLGKQDTSPNRPKAQSKKPRSEVESEGTPESWGKEKRGREGDSGDTQPGKRARVPGSAWGEKETKKLKRIKVTRTRNLLDGSKTQVVEYITDPVEIERLLAKRKAAMDKVARANDACTGVSKDGAADSSGPAVGSKLKIQINVRQLSQGAKSAARSKGSSAARSKGSSAASDRRRPTEMKSKLSSKSEKSKGGLSLAVAEGGVRKSIAPKGQVGKIKIFPKLAKQAQEEQLAKRKRSQYGGDLDYPLKKVARKSSTSRRKRNGTVTLNGILESVEKKVRDACGYIRSTDPVMIIVRLREGEAVPAGRIPNNLARPTNSTLDFTRAVDTKTTPMYAQVVKKQMYLDLIKQKCKQMKYESADQFLGDMRLLLANAKAFNTTVDVQWVVQHAQLLLEVAEEQIEARRDEIDSAEEQVKREKLEVSAKSSAHGSAKAEAGLKSKGSSKQVDKGSIVKPDEVKLQRPDESHAPGQDNGAANGNGSKTAGGRKSFVGQADKTETPPTSLKSHGEGTPREGQD